MPLRIVIFLLFCPTIAAGDVLHLKDGARHYGEVVRQDETGVEFRILMADGVSSVVATYRAAEVVRVERTARRVPPTVESRADPEPSEDARCTQMVWEALLLLEMDDRDAALRALQQAALKSTPADRPKLDRICQQRRERTLATLLAELRLRDADAAKGFTIRFVTPVERVELARLLRAYQQRLLAVKHGEYTLGQWVERRSSYDELRPDAPVLMESAARAAAVIEARLRWDPDVVERNVKRRDLARLRRDLVRLAGHVLRMPGYTTLDSRNARQRLADLLCDTIGARHEIPRTAGSHTAADRADVPATHPTPSESEDRFP